ncbi:uncharacterized protein LOC121875725 [Homarus americanus]|uniref:Uncharacterized protein n=1 Tax=Homarus americanus TaxID=6706 RepID=A0A8J5MR49_HOMAM|nr:uncharacterized protein LOC121875725 [Homarus americanus]KAG7160898.1 hypothetical protein Hamer_G007671 [Homarus americanus]
MATNKIAMKFRSITYPSHETSGQKKQRRKLQRMESFDFSQHDSPTVSTKSIVSRREVSAEGRQRTQHFHDTHAQSTPCTLAPGQKLLRFSDECWYSPAGEQAGRPHASVGCLTSPKSKPGAAVRIGVNSVERLVDWQRQSSDKHTISSSNSQEHSHRHSRSKERRSDRDSTSSEKRGHYCASVSLPPPSKSSEQNPTANTTTTTPPVTSETRGRRSQFRRAWSLFSLTCDKEVERDRREKSPQQRILRPPTRHFYRRGLSGLPIECSTRYLGLAY